MTYTHVIDEGVIIRDVDGITVSPAYSAADPVHQEWLTWCLAGQPVKSIASRGRVRVVPTEVTRRQMLIALHRGALLEPTKQAIAASGDVELQIAFNEALAFERAHPAIMAMASAFGKSEAEIDDLFILAATL